MYYNILTTDSSAFFCLFVCLFLCVKVDVSLILYLVCCGEIHLQRPLWSPLQILEGLTTRETDQDTRLTYCIIHNLIMSMRK